VIYLDSSIALAQLLAEERTPPVTIWQEQLTSAACWWNRLNARGVARSHTNEARLLLGRINFIELTRQVLQRALEPFPRPVRTLGSLHLASIEFLRNRRQTVELATCDGRLLDAARALGIAPAQL
jgi:hypothetical protein